LYIIYPINSVAKRLKKDPQTDLAGAEYIPPSHVLEDLHDDFCR
jgi:hypothetical protein